MIIFSALFKIMDTDQKKDILTGDDLTFYKQNIKYYFTGVILTILVFLILIYYRNNETISDNYQSIFCEN